MIDVYSKPNCPQCSATYRKLKSMGLPFNSIDITEDAEAAMFVRSLKCAQAPVVVVREGEEIKEHWSGFRPDLLKKYEVKDD